MSDFITLNCPTCGGKLQIHGDQNSFICGYCGNVHIFKHNNIDVGQVKENQSIRHAVASKFQDEVEAQMSSETDLKPMRRRSDAEWMRERSRRPAYGEWRTLVEDSGGTMHYERSGMTWVIRFGSKLKRIPTEGHHFRDLDLCYGTTPNRSSNPQDWDYYHGPFLQDRAISKLAEWFPEKFQESRKVD